MISLRSIEKKKKRKVLSVCAEKKKISKKTVHTVLNAEQIILSKYNYCVIANKLCVQITEYVLCVHCTAKDLICKNCDLNTSVSVLCSLIFFFVRIYAEKVHHFIIIIFASDFDFMTDSVLNIRNFEFIYLSSLSLFFLLLSCLSVYFCLLLLSLCIFQCIISFM